MLFDAPMEVRVLAKDATTVSLHIKAATSDEWPEIPATHDFALMLLHEAACAVREGGGRDGRVSPLDVAVSYDDLRDRKWLERYARGFVASVRATKQKRGWRRPSAQLQIAVTHPAWLEQIHAGARWESVASPLDEEVEFGECEPIAPEPAPEPIDDPEAFIYLPPEVSYVADDVIPERCPAWLEFPAYSPSAYTTGEVDTDPRTVRADWVGRAVRVNVHGDFQQDGALATPTELVQVTNDGGGRYSNFDSVARLVPIRGRRGSRLKYASTLSGMGFSARHVGTRQDGRQVEISFRVPPVQMRLAVHATADLIPLLDSRWDELLRQPSDGEPVPSRPTELAKALAADAENLGNADDLLWRVADKYIAGHTNIYPPYYDLDNLPPARARAIVTAPWPIVRVVIRVTDERWIPPATNPPPGPVRLWDFNEEHDYWDSSG